MTVLQFESDFIDGMAEALGWALVAFVSLRLLGKSFG
jgi:hypothetical protein